MSKLYRKLKVSQKNNINFTMFFDYYKNKIKCITKYN